MIAKLSGFTIFAGVLLRKQTFIVLAMPRCETGYSFLGSETTRLKFGHSFGA